MTLVLRILNIAALFCIVHILYVGASRSAAPEAMAAQNSIVRLVTLDRSSRPVTVRVCNLSADNRSSLEAKIAVEGYVPEKVVRDDARFGPVYDRTLMQATVSP